MGFPVGYTEVFLPKLFLRALSFLGLVRSLVFGFFHLLGLSDFLEPDAAWSDPPAAVAVPARVPECPPPVSSVLIQELLPVVAFEELADDGGSPLPESCAVCLHEFEWRQEIRWLVNCSHIFHRHCLDRWMDHGQGTCPLCRTPLVPDEMQGEFNQRYWASSGISNPYADYNSLSGM